MAVYLSWLVDAARLATSGTGKSVYVQPGWESRGHGGLRLVEVVVGHHTATPESSPGDYPSLNVVTYGRADLPGPLANLGLGRGGHIYVIAAGLAYHAGASAYAGYYDLNDESIGIEAEDSGDGVWTPEQLFMYPRLVAALLQYMSRGVDRYCSHRTCATPAGRKIDPNGISDEWMRHEATNVLQGGFDVAAVDWNEQYTHGRTGLRMFYGDWVGEIKDTVDGLLKRVDSMSKKVDAGFGNLSDDEANIIAAVNRAAAEGVDEQALAESLAPILAPLLAPMISAGATPEQVEAACTEAVRKVFADAGTP